MTPFERLEFRMEGKEADKIPNLNIEPFVCGTFSGDYPGISIYTAVFVWNSL